MVHVACRAPADHVAQRAAERLARDVLRFSLPAPGEYLIDNFDIFEFSFVLIFFKQKTFFKKKNTYILPEL